VYVPRVDGDRGERLDLERGRREPPDDHPGAEGLPEAPGVSPDGKSVLVASDTGELLLVDLTDGDSRKLMEAEGGCWSPDGSQLACLRASRRPETIAVLTTPKGEVTRELKTVRSTKIGYIAWSPDGAPRGVDRHLAGGVAGSESMILGTARIG